MKLAKYTLKVEIADPTDQSANVIVALTADRDYIHTNICDYVTQALDMFEDIIEEKYCEDCAAEPSVGWNLPPGEEA